MLRSLTMEKVSRVLEAADRDSKAAYTAIGFTISDDAGIHLVRQPAGPPGYASSGDSLELVAMLSDLTREEQVELAALFYSGRDRVDFYAMLQNGRNIAGRYFGAYLGGKPRFGQHVRAGLERLGCVGRKQLVEVSTFQGRL